MNIMNDEVVSALVGIVLMLWVYLRHSRISQKYADKLHIVSSQHPVLSQILFPYPGRSSESFEIELRRKNNARSVTIVIFVLAVLLLLPAFLSIWNYLFLRA